MTLTRGANEQETAHQVTFELRRLMGARGTGSISGHAQPPFTLSVDAVEAYVLVAVLQFASRNPQLTDYQRDAVLKVAHGVADSLTAAARVLLGPGSAVETTLRDGFDPSCDVAPEREEE
jgi:hypothetical protein